MINCPTIISINKESCLNNVGGLKLEAYIFPSENRTALTYDNIDWVLSALEYTNGSNPLLPISIQFHKNTANFTESAAGAVETTNSTNTVTLSITVNNRQYEKSKAINILGAGMRELDIIVSQKNGTNWFIPEAILTQTDSTSGTLKTDGSNYVLTFTAELDTLMYGIEDGDLQSLITTGSIGSI